MRVFRTRTSSTPFLLLSRWEMPGSLDKVKRSFFFPPHLFFKIKKKNTSLHPRGMDLRVHAVRLSVCSSLESSLESLNGSFRSFFFFFFYCCCSRMFLGAHAYIKRIYIYSSLNKREPRGMKASFLPPFWQFISRQEGTRGRKIRKRIHILLPPVYTWLEVLSPPLHFCTLTKRRDVASHPSNIRWLLLLPLSYAKGLTVFSFVSSPFFFLKKKRFFCFLPVGSAGHIQLVPAPALSSPLQ